MGESAELTLLLLQLLLGSLHVALTLPTGSGESYDAASRLMQVSADALIKLGEG